MTTIRQLQATQKTIVFYDPAAERRAAALNVTWDDYLNESENIILEDLQHGWFPMYAERQSAGLTTLKIVNNQMFSNFDPTRLVVSNPTLIRLHAFKAIEIFYSTVVTDASNVNEVDQTNYEFAQKRYQDEWSRARHLNNFYDINLDGLIDLTETTELTEDTSFYERDRRYF